MQQREIWTTGDSFNQISALMALFCRTELSLSSSMHPTLLGFSSAPLSQFSIHLYSWTQELELLYLAFVDYSVNGSLVNVKVNCTVNVNCLSFSFCILTSSSVSPSPMHRYSVFSLLTLIPLSFIVLLQVSSLVSRSSRDSPPCHDDLFEIHNNLLANRVAGDKFTPYCKSRMHFFVRLYFIADLFDKLGCPRGHPYDIGNVSVF